MPDFTAAVDRLLEGHEGAKSNVYHCSDHGCPCRPKPATGAVPYGWLSALFHPVS